jgi:hypothetical protein
VLAKTTSTFQKRLTILPFQLKNLSQIMLLKIFLEVNSQIRIRDISALMTSGQGDFPPETPNISKVSVFFTIIFRF